MPPPTRPDTLDLHGRTALGSERSTSSGDPTYTNSKKLTTALIPENCQTLYTQLLVRNPLFKDWLPLRQLLAYYIFGLFLLKHIWTLQTEDLRVELEGSSAAATNGKDLSLDDIVEQRRKICEALAKYLGKSSCRGDLEAQFDRLCKDAEEQEGWVDHLCGRLDDLGGFKTASSRNRMEANPELKEACVKGYEWLRQVDLCQSVTGAQEGVPRQKTTIKLYVLFGLPSSDDVFANQDKAHTKRRFSEVADSQAGAGSLTEDDSSVDRDSEDSGRNKISKRRIN